MWMNFLSTGIPTVDLISAAIFAVAPAATAIHWAIEKAMRLLVCNGCQQALEWYMLKEVEMKGANWSKGAHRTCRIASNWY